MGIFAFVISLSFLSSYPIATGVSSLFFPKRYAEEPLAKESAASSGQKRNSPRVDGILFMNQQDWVIWLDGSRITPVCPHALYEVLAVTPKEVILRHTKTKKTFPLNVSSF